MSHYVTIPPTPFLSIAIRGDRYAKKETFSGASFNGFHKRRFVSACIRAGPFSRYQMSSSSSSERSREIAVTREIRSSKFQTFSCGTASALLERQSRWTTVMDSSPAHAIIIMDALHDDMTWFGPFWCGTNDTGRDNNDERRGRVCYNSRNIVGLPRFGARLRDPNDRLASRLPAGSVLNAAGHALNVRDFTRSLSNPASALRTSRAFCGNFAMLLARRNYPRGYLTLLTIAILASQECSRE